VKESVLLVTWLLLESVTDTETVKVPLPVGVQERVVVLEELHPVGRPLHEYVLLPEPPEDDVVKVVLWPTSMWPEAGDADGVDMVSVEETVTETVPLVAW
jgi:hypothetical protein